MKINENNFENAKNYILNLLAPELNYEGMEIDEEKYAKFKEMSNLALDFFRKFKGYIIDVDIPSQYSETSNVSVEIPDFEVTEENKEQYLKILSLSEHTYYFSNTLNSFCISFTIFNVWKEESIK